MEVSVRSHQTIDIAGNEIRFIREICSWREEALSSRQEQT